MESKTVLSLKILETKYKIKRKHLVLPLILIVVFLINKRYFIYGLLTIASGVFSFYHDKYNKSPVDAKLPLVLGVMITREYGFFLAFLFFILSDLIPSLLGGGALEGTSLIFIGWFLMMYLAVVFFPQVDIILLGIILVVVEFLGGIVIKMFFGIPGIVAVVSSIISVIVRIIYFLTVGEVVKWMFRII